ncbi:MAG: hypothetical protein ACREBR_01445, partial [bacterium]
MAILGQGKTNQFGKIEFGAAMRNRVRLCLFGALAMWLFWTFEIEGEPYPDFSESRNWYDTKVICSKHKEDPTKELSYKAHYNAVMGALKKAGVVSKAKTHAGRGSSVRIAELEGCEEGDLRRLGRWNTQAMEGCYLSELPRASMRVLAGFDSHNRTFYINRDIVQPSEQLMAKIFPRALSLLEIEVNRTNPNLAANGFLKLLVYLRKILLQDAVLLKERFPTHRIWSHPVFGCEEFLAFKDQLVAYTEQNEMPVEVNLRSAMPLLMEYLRDSHRNIHHQIHSNEATTRFEARGLKKDISSVKGEIVQLLSGATMVTRLQLPSSVGMEYEAEEVDCPCRTADPQYYNTPLKLKFWQTFNLKNIK